MSKLKKIVFFSETSFNMHEGHLQLMVLFWQKNVLLRKPPDIIYIGNRNVVKNKQ